jgi:putative endonuclease
MAGLVPAIHVFMLRVMERGGFVYFMTNRRNGVLYVGVTSNLPARGYQHREGLVDGFTKRYGLKVLVYYECFDGIRDAIAREKAIKHWSRAWKVRLIHQMNPEWRDLYADLTRDGHPLRSCPRMRASTSFFACGKTWMAGTGPAMTVRVLSSCPRMRAPTSFFACGKTWMAGTSPAMTG